MSQTPIYWELEPFTPRQANKVKSCLREILKKSGRVEGSIDAAWLRVLDAARIYQDALQIKDFVQFRPRRLPDGKIQFSWVRPKKPSWRDKAKKIDRLTQKFDPGVLAVRIVKGIKQGRDSNVALDAYVAAVCEVYCSISGKLPSVSWDRYTEKATLVGPFSRLLRACFAPTVFHYQSYKKRVLRDLASINKKGKEWAVIDAALVKTVAKKKGVLVDATLASVVKRVRPRLTASAREARSEAELRDWYSRAESGTLDPPQSPEQEREALNEVDDLLKKQECDRLPNPKAK